MTDPTEPDEPTTTAAPPPPPPPPPPRPEPPLGARRAERVRRSRYDRVLGGVAGGIARTFGIEPLWVRLGFMLATLMAGIGVVAYVVAWIVLPEEPVVPDAPPARRADLRQLVGFALLGLGMLFVADRIGFAYDEGILWPLALIGIGGAVLWLRSRDQAQEDAEIEDVEAPTEPPPPTEPLPAARAWAPATPAPIGWSPPGSRWPTAPVPPVPPRPPVPPEPRRRPSKLAPLTLSVVLLVLGSLWLLDASGAADVGPGGVLAAGLVGVGAGLLVGTWWGHAPGLIVVGLLLTAVLTFLSFVDLRLGAGVGDETYRPTRISELEEDYELGIGHLVVDLSGLDLEGRTEDVYAAVGIGEVEVIVPNGVELIVDGDVGIGEVVLFGQSDDGFEASDTLVQPGREGAGELHLEVHGGIGRVEVRRPIVDSRTGEGS